MVYEIKLGNDMSWSFIKSALILWESLELSILIRILGYFNTENIFHFPYLFASCFIYEICILGVLCLFIISTMKGFLIGFSEQPSLFLLLFKFVSTLHF